MELILVRHARPFAVDDDPNGADPELTPEGHQQAQVLAAAFGSGALGPVTGLVSSTMRRAVQTAAPVAEALGMTVETDVRLVELDQGWRRYGVDFSEYPTRAAAWEAMNSGSWGGQHYDPAAFVARVTAGVEDAIARHSEGSLVIVCHGGVISAYLAAVVGSPRPLFFTPAYTSLTRIMALPDGHRELLTAGEAPHVVRAV